MHFRDFWDVLDAINWDRVRLDTSRHILKIWSTCVDLLGNISTCFHVKNGENGPKSWKIRMSQVCLHSKITGRPGDMVDSAFES